MNFTSPPTLRFNKEVTVSLPNKPSPHPLHQGDVAKCDNFCMKEREPARSVPLQNNQLLTVSGHHVNGTGASKMADDVENVLDVSLDNLVSVTEKSGNLKKGLKDLILKSVSNIRKVVTELRTCVEKSNIEKNALHAKVKQTEKQLQEERNLRLRSRQAKLLIKLDGMGWYGMGLAWDWIELGWIWMDGFGWMDLDGWIWMDGFGWMDK
ncbi:hypothetical protein C0J52_21655 [Blattella germanica]|nr:hypothetical protein C0J52_21655 [Blattella germanica]